MRNGQDRFQAWRTSPGRRSLPYLENMNLKEVGIEFEDLGRDGPFNKINHGGNYLWHVARKLASIWMDNKVDNLVIFSPRFDRRCYKYDPQAREFDPNEDAEDNHFVKICAFRGTLRTARSIIERWTC